MKLEKKIVSIIMSGIIVFGLSGCGNQSSIENKKNDVKKIVQKENIILKSPYKDESEIGQGTFVLSTAGGTTENGNIPTVLWKTNQFGSFASVQLNNFNEKLYYYVYIDGIQILKGQGADIDSTIELPKNLMIKGKHEVDVVQYEGNDTKANVITLKKAYFNLDLQ